MAADHDRHAGFLDRLRIRFDGVPAIEASVEGLRRVGPQRPDRAHGFLGARGALAERYADHGELFREPADSDAEDRAAAREHVERRELLRDVDRVALRQDHDARGEPHALADRGGVGERDDRIGDRRLLASRASCRPCCTDTASRSRRAPPRARRSTAIRCRPRRRFARAPRRSRAARTGRRWRRRGRTSCGAPVSRRATPALLLRADLPGQVFSADARLTPRVRSSTHDEPSLPAPGSGASHAGSHAQRSSGPPALAGLHAAARRAGVLRLRLLELLPAAEVPGDAAARRSGGDRARHRALRPVRRRLPAGDGRGGRSLRSARLPDGRGAGDGGRFAGVRRRRSRGSAALRVAGGPGHCLRDGLRRRCDVGRRRGAARTARPGDRDLRPDLSGDECDRPRGLGGDRAARRLAGDVRGGGRAGARQRGALASVAGASGGARPGCARQRPVRAGAAAEPAARDGGDLARRRGPRRDVHVPSALRTRARHDARALLFRRVRRRGGGAARGLRALDRSRRATPRRDRDALALRRRGRGHERAPARLARALRRGARPRARALLSRLQRARARRHGGARARQDRWACSRRASTSARRAGPSRWASSPNARATRQSSWAAASCVLLALVLVLVFPEGRR